MIHETKMQELLLNDSRFFQTGSRYWNKLDPSKVPLIETTDWDFVTEYSEERARSLMKIGFINNKSKCINDISGEMYTDGSTVVVLYFGDSIQVIMKKNVKKYNKIMATVGVDFYVNYLWKKNVPIAQIQNTMNFLYGLYQDQVEDLFPEL
jgi:hypothetical protein